MRARHVLLGLGLALLYAGSACARPEAKTIARLSQANFQEYLELLSLPNIPANANDMQRNAAFLERSFQKRGFKTQLLDNPAGRPLVFAEFPEARSGARTVLFYAHFDGQPVVNSEWAQSSPFEPVVRKPATAGRWTDVDTQQLFKQPLDPELRVFARSASDDKAPIMMLLTAIDLLKAERATPAIRIKVLLDSEEEIGSPILAATVAAHEALFKADALVVLDGPQHRSSRPTLVFGNRGETQATLTVYGPRAPLHSGHFGNYAPNPAQRLARLLASMKDDDGRVLIPGYYDGVNLTPSDRVALTSVGDDEEALRTQAGFARAERVGANYQEALQFPSLNVRGMAAASIGANAANIVPSEAVAELDIRTTPETDGRRLFELVKKHIEAQGYRLVDGAPTDAERAAHDKLATFHLGSVQDAMRMPMDAPVGRWAFNALKTGTGQEPVRIRMMGGTVPTDVLVSALRLPFLLIPTVNADNNQHTHDENLRIGHFLSGTEAIYGLFMSRY
jgi:acetylornithine deacetylase/succinyl-diaminopimelate desuccinylase-like protein